MIAALLATVSATPEVYAQDTLPGEGKTVQFAQIGNDDTGWIITYVYAQMLDELGYEVPEPLSLDVPVAFQAVAQGSADLYPDAWFPLHNTYMEGVEDGAEKVGYVVKQGALQGYLVDAESAEKYDIKTLDDFKRPEVKKAFDRNGDGKADMVACPPGWGCELTISYQMKAFGLEGDINQIKAGYPASMADAIAAHENGEPILFYTWTPNWTVNELKPGKDVMWIETPSVALPEEQQDMADAATVSGVKGCVEDPCQLGWPVNDIRTVGNSQFLDDNPAVRKLLEDASIDVDFIYAQNAAMRNGEDTVEDIKRQAADYVEQHRDEIDGWLQAATEAAQ